MFVSIGPFRQQVLMIFLGRFKIVNEYANQEEIFRISISEFSDNFLIGWQV